MVCDLQKLRVNTTRETTLAFWLFCVRNANLILDGCTHHFIQKNMVSPYHEDEHRDNVRPAAGKLNPFSINNIRAVLNMHVCVCVVCV